MREVNPSIVQVASDLKVHPKFRGCVEDASKEDGSFRCHVALCIDQGVDSLNGNSHPLGKLDLAHIQRDQELLEQDLSRMSWLSVLWNHGKIFQ
jgi:hypothetical protein